MSQKMWHAKAPSQLDGRKRRVKVSLLIYNSRSRFASVFAISFLRPLKFSPFLSMFTNRVSVRTSWQIEQVFTKCALDFRASNQIASNKQTKNNIILIVNLNLYISKCYFCLNNNILLITLPTHYLFQLTLP